jgi:glycosyltransferase involved in cell wall biosynthesis
MVPENRILILQQPTLSIILPCYNPTGNWDKKVVNSVRQIAAETNLKELIIVNDGSSKDLSVAVDFIRRNCHTQFIYAHYAGNRGKGYAIRTGLAKATSDLIVYTDIDFPYTHESFMEIYYALEAEEGDIVIGIKETSYYQNVPLGRRIISKALRKMIALLLHIKITDTQCGLKGMQQQTKYIWERGTINRYLFDLEAVYNASKRKLSLKVVPVVLREGVVFSKIPFTLLLGELKNFLKITIAQ